MPKSVLSCRTTSTHPIVQISLSATEEFIQDSFTFQMISRINNSFSILDLGVPIYGGNRIKI